MSQWSDPSSKFYTHRHTLVNDETLNRVANELETARVCGELPAHMQAVIDASVSSGAGTSAAESEAELDRATALADGEINFSDRKSGGVNKRGMAAAGRARRATRAAAKNAEKSKKDAENLSVRRAHSG